MAALPRPYGRYILEERIAMGGMAEIFRARTDNSAFEKRVCIKRVLPQFLSLDDEETAREFITMFRDEARLAAKLQHANVVQVFDFGEIENDDGNRSLYLAMELVDGVDLKRVLESARRKRQQLTFGECAQIAIDVCRGLHHAHTLTENGRPLGIVHRDVSPHNILVSRAGEVKVTDFGIAKAAERATHTSTGLVKGKLAYMAPEQAQGLPYDHRLDQFALGVVLWEMLTGARLFGGDGEAAILHKVIEAVVTAPSSLRPDTPAALDEIVLRALSKRASDRYADMREMEQALTRFLFSGAVDASSVDVRNIFARVVDGDSGRSRKTMVADAPAGLAELNAPPALSGVPPSQSLPSASAALVSQSAVTDPLAAEAAAALQPAGTASVFTSSDKRALPWSADDDALARGAAPVPTLPRADDPLLAQTGDAARSLDVPSDAGREGSGSRASLQSLGALDALDRAAARLAPPPVGAATRTLTAPSDPPQTALSAFGTHAPDGTSPTGVSTRGGVPAPAPAPAPQRASLGAAGVVAVAVLAAVALAFGLTSRRQDAAPLAAAAAVPSAAAAAVVPVAGAPAAAPPTPPVAPVATATAPAAAPADPPVAATLTSSPAPTAAAGPAEANTGARVLKQEVDVAPRPATRPGAPPRTGTVAIDTEPWSTVYENGKRLDDTPTTITLPAGRHRLELVAQSGARQSVDVEIKAGKRALVRRKLNAP